MICDKCQQQMKEMGEYMYPIYGLAPHHHNLKKTGSIIGSTEIFQKDKWPDNFIEDPEALGCGVYYCPDHKCNNGKEKAMAIKSRLDEIQESGIGFLETVDLP